MHFFQKYTGLAIENMPLELNFVSAAASGYHAWKAREGEEVQF